MQKKNALLAEDDEEEQEEGAEVDGQKEPLHSTFTLPD
jgi:hypothetical protein